MDPSLDYNLRSSCEGEAPWTNWNGEEVDLASKKFNRSDKRGSRGSFDQRLERSHFGGDWVG